MELQEYRCALYHHIFWKRKEQFVLLRDNFIQDSIDMEAFEIDLKELKNFELDSNSDGFSRFSSIYNQNLKHSSRALGP